MWKDIFAIYGGMRLLDDIAKSSPPQNTSDNSAGCGCLIVIVVIIVIMVSC